MPEMDLLQKNRTGTRQLLLQWWPQVAVILLVIVELCWILPWFRMVMQITHAAPLWKVALILGGIMLAAYGLGVGLEFLRLKKNIQAVSYVVLLGASLLLAENLLLNRPVLSAVNGLALLDPGAVLVLFFVTWMWQRGMSLSHNVIRPMTAWRRFELGLLFFMAYIFIAARLDFYTPGFGVFILFLFSGLMAVIFARISYVGINKGVRKNPFDLRWLASVSGILGATVTLAGLAGSLITGQYRLFLDFLAETVKFLIAAIIFILGLPGLLASYLVGPAILWLRTLFAQPTPTPNPEYPMEFSYPILPVNQELTRLPIAFQTLCFWGLVALVFLILVGRIRKTLASRREHEPREPEALLKRGEAKEILRQALQEILNGWAARLRPAQRILAAARIRRVYAQLMDLCEDLDCSRPAATTPLEFLPIMGEVFSTQTENLITLTEAYIRVRYGEFPENEEEIEAVETAWQNILEEGRRIKHAGAGKLKTVEVKEVERVRM